jgi:hypothetical protein
MKKASFTIALSFYTLLAMSSADMSFGRPIHTYINNQKTLETPPQAVRSFLYWYRNNIDRLNKIQLVDQSPGKPYSVNKTNVAKYLVELKKSGFLGKKFLKSIEHYIDICDANLLKIKQTEGPPEGFDMDMVLLMQDYESDFKLLDKAKASSLTKTKIKFTFASENFLVFRMAQIKGKWFVESIE